jgi:hypothetical protein
MIFPFASVNRCTRRYGFFVLITLILAIVASHKVLRLDLQSAQFGANRSPCEELQHLTFAANSPSLFFVSAEAWIVECAGCKCLIVACGIDPQDEHGKSQTTETPLKSVVLNCPCCDGDYRYAGNSIMRGRPKRNPACMRRQEQPRPKQDGALVIAASIVAVIRLRGEAIANSPKVTAAVSDSLQLARMVMARLDKDR